MSCQAGDKVAVPRVSLRPRIYMPHLQHGVLPLPPPLPSSFFSVRTNPPPLMLTSVARGSLCPDASIRSTSRPFSASQMHSPPVSSSPTAAST